MDIRSRVSYLPKKKSWDFYFKYNFDNADLQVKLFNYFSTKVKHIYKITSLFLETFIWMIFYYFLFINKHSHTDNTFGLFEM